MLILKQFKKLINDPNRYNVYFGGRASGKSVGVCQSLLVIGSQKKVKILCCREYQSSLGESVYSVMCSIIKDEKLSCYTIKSNKIVCKNGTEIIFKGLSTSTGTSLSLKSIADIDICFVEEAQTISKRSLDILLPTIRKQGSWFVFVFNPYLESDPVYDTFIKHKMDNCFVCKMNYTDNPLCPDTIRQEAESLKKFKLVEYNEIYGGEIHNQASNPVIPYFSEDNIRECKIDEYQPLYIGFDFNIGLECTSIAQIDRQRENIFYVDEILKENATTYETCLEIIKRYKSHPNKIIINGDASGNSRSSNSISTNYDIIHNLLHQTFGNRLIIDVPNSNPSIKNRYNTFNNLVMNHKGERHLFIDPKCTCSIYNMKYLKYRVTKDNSVKEEIDEKSYNSERSLEENSLSHLTDAMSYITSTNMYIDMETTPISKDLSIIEKLEKKGYQFK